MSDWFNVMQLTALVCINIAVINVGINIVGKLHLIHNTLKRMENA